MTTLADISERIAVFPVQDSALFRNGDIVKLKSGGPKMTIASTGNGQSRIFWFDRTGLNETTIPNDAIRKIEVTVDGTPAQT